MTEVLDYIEFVLAPQVVTGLAFGVAVILVAIGLTIIFGLLDVINMSHGEFYAFGAFGALALGWLGVPFWLLLVLVPLAMLPVGYAVERVLIQRVFNRTRLGAMVRAAAFDRNMAASLGVPVAWVYAGAFAFGISLAGFAGVLLAPIYSVFPTMGRDFILMAFTVVIVGGMGSIAGAVVAGLFLTQVQAIAALYISPVWTDPIVFGIIVVMLMVRPQGLFGRLGYACR